MAKSNITIFKVRPGKDPVEMFTIERMVNIIKKGKYNPRLRKLIVNEIVGGIPQGDKKAEFNAVWRWVRKNVEYRNDPNNLELIQDAWTIIETGAGDCDDFTILLCTIYEILGFPTFIKVISLNPQRIFQHVYPLVQVGKQRIAVDLVPDTRFGGKPTFHEPPWEVNGITNSEVVEVDTPYKADVAVLQEIRAIAGLSGLGSTQVGQLYGLDTLSQLAMMGSFFSKIKKGFKKIGSAVKKVGKAVTGAVKKVASVATKIPGVKQAMSFAKKLPGVKQATSLVSKAANIVNPANLVKAVTNPVAFVKEQAKNVQDIASNPLIKMAMSNIPGGQAIMSAAQAGSSILQGKMPDIMAMIPGMPPQVAQAMETLKKGEDLYAAAKNAIAPTAAVIDNIANFDKATSLLKAAAGDVKKDLVKDVLKAKEIDASIKALAVDMVANPSQQAAIKQKMAQYSQLKDKATANVKAQTKKYNEINNKIQSSTNDLIKTQTEIIKKSELAAPLLQQKKMDIEKKKDYNEWIMQNPEFVKDMLNMPPEAKKTLKAMLAAKNYEAIQILYNQWKDKQGAILLVEQAMAAKDPKDFIKKVKDNSKLYQAANTPEKMALFLTEYAKKQKSEGATKANYLIQKTNAKAVPVKMV